MKIGSRSGSALQLSLLFCLLVSTALAAAQDFQQWNEVDLTASWRRVDFLVPLLARTDTSLPNPQLAATGITADFPMPWSLTLTGGYLFADLPQRSDFVHLPLIALTKSFHVRRFAVTDRNRFEKLVGFGTSPVRYRNRILADLPLGAGDRWHAFVGEEILFDLSDRRWNQNRFQAGAGVHLNHRLLMDLYYLRRDSEGPSPSTHVLGTTLRITLRPG